MRTNWITRVAATGGTVSLLVTGFWVAVRPRSEPHGPTLVLWLLEAAILLVLVFLSVRTARPRPATVGGVLAAVALSVSLLRFGSLNSQVATGCCAWGLGAAVAGLAGAYLRSLDTGRQRAVEQARLQLRLELASDLHDFVAHDVSEILAQAQAAQILARTEPGRLPLALERITTAAVRALDTLDRTVNSALQERPPTETGPVHSIEDLALLVNRFRSSGIVPVDLQLQDEAVAALGREAGEEVYRAVVEALTNIRRHAAEAQQVHIVLRPGTTAGVVELSVTDDAPHADPAGTGHTGLGLAALSARIRQLGGTTWAGPGRPTGWRLCVTLPAATDGAAILHRSQVAVSAATRVLIADDQEVIREAFSVILNAEADIEVIAEAGDGRSALEQARRMRPDVVLADIRMPLLDGLGLTRELAGPGVPDPIAVVVVTTFDLDEYVYTALENGACGFLLKRSTPTLLVEAVRPPPEVRR